MLLCPDLFSYMIRRLEELAFGGRRDQIISHAIRYRKSLRVVSRNWVEYNLMLVLI